MELTLDWPGLVKPRVTECMEWLQSDAENGGAVGCAWRQPVEEDGASSRLCPSGLSLVSPEMSHDDILIPMVMASIGGAFVSWWSHKDGASSIGWVLLYIRDTQSSRAFPPIWGYNKCVTRKDPEWPGCGNPFPLFMSVIFCYSNPEGLRQHPIFRQFSKPHAIGTKVQSTDLVWCNTVTVGWQFAAGFHKDSWGFCLLGSMARMINNYLILLFS